MQSIINILKRILPEDSAGRRAVRYVMALKRVEKISLLIAKHLYNKRVRPLLNPDVLNEKIAFVQAMADSADAKKEYCVITWYGPENVGLCSHVFAYVSTIAYSLAAGKIPVIDMQNYANGYLEKEKLGKENAWEYYFEQPFEHGLDSIREDSTVVEWGPKSSRDLSTKLTGNEPIFDVLFQIWATIFRRLIRLNDAAKTYIDGEYNSLFKPGMRVLGVNCRGADYNPVMAPGHYIQPDIDTLISKVKTAMAEWRCDYIFLATPEKKSYDIFCDCFPGKVLQNKTAYYDNNDDADFSKQLITSVKFNRTNDVYLKGLEYLTTIVILSRCTSAVFGQTGGTMMAQYINDGKYENIYVFDLGKY